jgi:CubicO group peptidase (beta-lactamase class C family)
MDHRSSSVRNLDAAVRAVGARGLGVEGVHVAARGLPPVSKTVTSMAVGIADAEGLLDLSDPVLTHLGHLAPAPKPEIEQITIRHLLTMSSGITYRWDDPDSDHPDDPGRDILNAPIEAAPGTRFGYRGANTYLLSRIIHACTGQDLRDYLVPRLFTPLGINNPQWLRCPRGYSLGAVGLHLRTEELARLARLLLDHGHWHGRPIIPADYVNGMTADSVPTDPFSIARTEARWFCAVRAPNTKSRIAYHLMG